MLDLKASFHSPEDSYEGNNQREKDFLVISLSWDFSGMIWCSDIQLLQEVYIVPDK